jgi:hypothetical protein
MDTMQARGNGAATGELMPAVQAAFENWTRLNTHLTKIFFDVSVAQLDRIQDLMRLPTASAAGNGTSEPQKLWQKQVDELKRQMEDSIGVSRRIADETRQSLFDMASTMLEVPLAAQAQVTQTLTGAARKEAAR